MYTKQRRLRRCVSIDERREFFTTEKLSVSLGADDVILRVYYKTGNDVTWVLLVSDVFSDHETESNVIGTRWFMHASLQDIEECCLMSICSYRLGLELRLSCHRALRVKLLYPQ